jgi:hypothetical protein
MLEPHFQVLLPCSKEVSPSIIPLLQLGLEWNDEAG